MRQNVILWHALAFAVSDSHGQLGLSKSLLSGFAPPSDRFSVILAGTLTIFVTSAEPELGLRMSLIGGFAPQTGGFGVVFWLVAAKVRKGKVELGLGMSLIGGFAIPLVSFDEISRYSRAAGVRKTKPELGVRLS